MTDTPKIFLAAPSYDHTRSDGSANGLRFASRRYGVNTAMNADSLMDWVESKMDLTCD